MAEQKAKEFTTSEGTRLSTALLLTEKWFMEEDHD